MKHVANSILSAYFSTKSFQWYDSTHSQKHQSKGVNRKAWKGEKIISLLRNCRENRFITLRKPHLWPVHLQGTNNTEKVLHRSPSLYLTQKGSKRNNNLNKAFLMETIQIFFSCLQFVRKKIKIHRHHLYNQQNHKHRYVFNRYKVHTATILSPQNFKKKLSR